jgi:flap endonuclease-1
VKPDEEALKEFLVAQKGFTENKVENGLKKLKACQGKANQGRLDSFFKSAVAKTSSSTPATKAPKGQPTLAFKKSMPAQKK